MGRSARIFGFVFLLLALANPSGAVIVGRVIDGDTIELSSGETVRYIGVDTPETVHPQKPVEFMGKEASAFNMKLVEGKDIRLEYDVERRDRYGRTLAYVYVDTLFVNAALVRSGFAQVLTIPPNVKYAEYFVGLEQAAREAGLGLWNEEAARVWTTASPEQTRSEFYITRSGEKYHRAGCRYLARSAIPTSEEDAIARGYAPCSVCVGASGPNSGRSYSRSNSRESSSPSRCQATTKKGAQCKRNAKPGSRYCWQHGG